MPAEFRGRTLSDLEVEILDLLSRQGTQTAFEFRGQTGASYVPLERALRNLQVEGFIERNYDQWFLTRLGEDFARHEDL